MSRASSPNPGRLVRSLGPAAWVVGGQVYAKLVSFASYYLMVRYLAPGDVGLVALCWITIVVGETFFDLGLSQAYVRDGVRDARAESTLFWSVAVLALLWIAGSLVAGFTLGRVLEEPALFPALAALSLIHAIKATCWTQLSIQIVERRVPGITARDCVSATAGSVLGVALAMHGAGAWSLVGRLLCFSLVTAALTVATTRWRPRLELDRAWLKRTLRFGLPLTAASNVHWLVVLQVEGYLVGGTLGLQALGLLQFAKKPTEVLAQLMLAVQRFHLLREFSTARADVPRLRAMVRRESPLYLGFGLLVALASLGFAFLVIEPVWGDAWGATVPLVALLAVAAPFVTLQTVAASGLVALGDLRALLRANVVGAAFTCAALLLAAPHGLVALAAAQAASLAVTSALTLAALRRRTGSAAAPHAHVIDEQP